MDIYTSYIYIWYDTKSRFFYIGGHKGKVEDSYICSNKPMKRAYNKRPETFRFKVLEYVNGDVKELREAEQKWLDMIQDQELMNTKNVQNKTCRYYNVKKNSVGGNGSANKGNSNIGGWNRGLTGVQEHSPETRKKMSKSAKLRHAKNGVSLETRRKIGEASRGRKHKHSEESKQKMRESALRRYAKK